MQHMDCNFCGFYVVYGDFAVFPRNFRLFLPVFPGLLPVGHFYVVERDMFVAVSCIRILFSVGYEQVMFAFGELDCLLRTILDACKAEFAVAFDSDAL